MHLKAQAASVSDEVATISETHAGVLDDPERHSAIVRLIQSLEGAVARTLAGLALQQAIAVEARALTIASSAA